MVNQTYHPDPASIPFFFIIARPRSGTTLLRTLLDAHPNVNIPVESPLLIRLFGKYGRIKYWDIKKLNAFYGDLLKVYKFDRWKVNHNKLKNELLSFTGKQSYKTICKLVYLNFISFYPKEDILILGDKNPNYSKFPGRIYNLFPEARYIHLTRDYRDHTLSMLQTGLSQPVISFLAYQWKYSYILVSRLIKKHSHQFLTIRYEDLVTDTEEIMKKVCTFLEIPYKQEMLHYAEKETEIKQQLPQFDFKKFASRLFNPIGTDRVKLWQKQMKEHEIKISDLIVGKCAEIAGYQRKYRHFSMFYYLKAIPAIIYIRLSYFRRFLMNRMPPGIRRRINFSIDKAEKVIFRNYIKSMENDKCQKSNIA